MKTDKMILGDGKNAVYSMDSDVTGVNNNVIVCAGSGCGKTVSIMEPRLLETVNSSLVVTVTKRRLVDKYKYLFLKRGYDVLDLNFVRPMESNIAYDPLRYVSSYADITFLAESIVKANPRKDKSNADPYWDDASISLLSALIAFVLTVDKKATFADVLALNDVLSINDGGAHLATSLDSEFDRLAQKDPNCFAVTCWNSFKVLPIKTGSCVYGTLNTTLDTIFTPELRKMIGQNNNVDFEALASKKTILFVSTSAVNPALNCFINMFYAQMFKQLFEFAETRPNGQLPLNVGVLADDFATGCRILNFPEYISIFREKRINVTLLIQSESQLERMYGYEDAITIINNCDTYVYMGGMDIRTGRNISERLNAPLEDVLYMPVGQEIIFRRGQRPVVTQRYNVYENKLYKAVTMRYNEVINACERRERG
jgi:type IV secretory pathway TraG/TraD family ATPase VirD4